MRNITLEQVSYQDLEVLFSDEEKKILRFMEPSELQLLDEYIVLFNELKTIEEKNLSKTELNSIKKVIDPRTSKKIYVPTLKSITESYNQWKIISLLDIFNAPNKDFIDFEEVKKYFEKLNKPELSKKLDLRIDMWQKEKHLVKILEQSAKKFTLSMSLKKLINSKVLKQKPKR